MVGSDSSMLVVALGAATFAAAVIWRQAAGRRRIARLEHQLDSTEPERRAAAGQLAVTHGLGVAARCLMPRVEHEDDSGVRAAIALAVAHRQWEPGGSERVLALRLWAASELAEQGYDINPFGPAFTRISDMGGPPRPAPPTAAPIQPARSTPAGPDDEKARTS